MNKMEDKLTCSIDGNCLSIVRKNFINLAESPSIFIELSEKQINEINALIIN